MTNTKLMKLWKRNRGEVYGGITKWLGMRKSTIEMIVNRELVAAWKKKSIENKNYLNQRSRTARTKRFWKKRQNPLPIVGFLVLFNNMEIL